MDDLDKRIEEFSEELFADLGPVALPEEKKAEVFARIEEHLHRVILEVLTPVLNSALFKQLHDALEQENYRALSRFLKKHPQFRETLEEKLQAEFNNLRLTIAEEQKNVA